MTTNGTMTGLVVGHGRMGRNHARVLRSLGVKVATVDPDPKARADYRTIEDAPAAGFACISTPAGELAGQAMEAMNRGMDVLVEKPFAHSVAEAQQIRSVAKETGRMVAVGFTERSNPAVFALKNHLPKLGPVRYIAAARLGLPPERPVAPPALDLATHDLDVVRYLLDTEPEISDAYTDEETARYRLRSGTDLVDIEASHASDEKVRKLTVTGPEGMLVVDYQAQTLSLAHEDGFIPARVHRHEPLRYQWERFLQGEPTATGEDGLAAVSLACQSPVIA